jgi:hypothetical protein
MTVWQGTKVGMMEGKFGGLKPASHMHKTLRLNMQGKKRKEKGREGKRGADRFAVAGQE